MSRFSQLWLVATIRMVVFVAVFQLMHVGWLGQFAAAGLLVLMTPPPKELR